MDSLVKEIEKELELSEQISSELIPLEQERLNKAVQIALKGIKFKKIFSLIGRDPETHKSIRQYLTYKNGNKEIKAIFLESIRSIEDDDCNEYLVSLVMDNEGKFHVIEKSYAYDYWDNLTKRRIVREDIDVFTDKPLLEKYLEPECENKWDIDNIYKELEDNLKERLDNLKERNKEQTKRLEEIKSLIL